MGRLEGPASGSGECGLVAGTDGTEGEWRDSSRRDWLVEMAAIGLGDLTGEDWGIGSGGRPNMSAKASRRSCVALVVVRPLSPVVAWWTICP